MKSLDSIDIRDKRALLKNLLSSTAGGVGSSANGG